MKEAVFLQEVKEIQLLKNALTLLDCDFFFQAEDGIRDAK